MYKKDREAFDIWNIYSPDGDYVCAVSSETEADVLLSHLNRG